MSIWLFVIGGLAIYFWFQKNASIDAVVKAKLKTYEELKKSSERLAKHLGPYSKEELWEFCIEARATYDERGKEIIEKVRELNSGECNYRKIVTYIIAEEWKKRINKMTDNHYSYFLEALFDETGEKNDPDVLLLFIYNSNNLKTDENKIYAFQEMIKEIKKATDIIPEDY